MAYTGQLPSLSELRQLVKLVSVFPASAQQFLDTAERAGSGQNVLSFLRLFHPDELFDDSQNFITRCEDMELLINQKLDSPKEILHSSEG